MVSDVFSSNLNVCMQCGTCVASCSVKYTLNLRKIITGFLAEKANFWSDELWDCTTCRICQDRCPRGIRLTDLIVEARSGVVETGKIPGELRDLLESVYKFGNPFGVSQLERKKWRKGMDLKVADKDEFEFLFFPGCSSVDPSLREVARKAAELLIKAGVDFAILENEMCCGNDVRVIGELGLFEEIVERNRKVFSETGVEKVIVTSPHCYYVFKNFYGLEVYHISEILLEKVRNAELVFSYLLEKRVTYHDPCYLGRYSGIYEAPRELIKSISGIEFVEMQRNRELSLCCGAGGGNIVRDIKYRPSLRRIDEALLTASDILAVSCPFCHMMLEDAVKVKKAEIEVKDVVELVHTAVFGD